MTPVDYDLAEPRAFQALIAAFQSGDRRVIRAALREWEVAVYQRRLFG
jgi:hypothetical protein